MSHHFAFCKRCIVCLEDFEESADEEKLLVWLRCGHTCHMRCLEMWHAKPGIKACPTCKRPCEQGGTASRKRTKWVQSSS